MGRGLFLAGSVLVPLAFGLVPGFLPSRSTSVVRWILWLGVLGLATWYGYAMRDAPPTYRALAWGRIAVSASLSLVVLVFGTGRRRAVRRRDY